MGQLQFENLIDPPNLTGLLVRGVSPGRVMVRLEYVTSQDHVDRVKQGNGKPEAVELVMDARQARKLAEAFSYWANSIDTSLHAGNNSKQ